MGLGRALLELDEPSLEWLEMIESAVFLVFLAGDWFDNKDSRSSFVGGGGSGGIGFEASGIGYDCW